MKEQKGQETSTRKRNIIILAVLLTLLVVTIVVSAIIGNPPIRNIAPIPGEPNVSQSEIANN